MTTRAQENLAGARIVRAYRQETRGARALRERSTTSTSTKNMQLVRLYGLMNPAFGLLAGLGAVTVLGVGGTLAVRGTISVGALRGVRSLPRHADLAAHRVRLGRQSVSARCGIDGAARRDPRSARRRSPIRQRRASLPAAVDRALGRIPRRRISLSTARATPRLGGCCATSRFASPPARRSPSSARRAAARARCSSCSRACTIHRKARCSIDGVPITIAAARCSSDGRSGSCRRRVFCSARRFERT